MSRPAAAVLGELHWRSGASLAAEIQAGKISSAAALEAFIARVEALNSGVNAVVVKDYERARRRASEADEALKRGERWGPLHGVPMTVKENNDVEGLASTCGYEMLKGNVALAHSDAVQRLVNAGAVIFGKTNLPVGINDVQSFNPVYGCTSNPYDLTRTAGGSSGGSAAALAAGLCPLELGGDIGGSIRTPAHCCGLWGLKPTYGVISTRGGKCLLPDAQVSFADSTGFTPLDLVVKGPLARYPEDLALLLDVLAGPGGAEARGWTLSLPKPAPKPLSHYRVAIWADDAICPVDSDVQAAVRKTIDVLKAAGATVDEAARPPFTSEEMFETYLQLLAAAENVGLSPEDAAKAFAAADAAEGDSDAARQARWIGQRHHTWFAAHKRRLLFCEQMEAFFKSYDHVIMPICASTAWPHDHSGPNDQPFWKVGDRVITGADGQRTPYHKQVYWAALATVCYLPSVTFPAGRGGNGMPVGLQALGAKYTDHGCIAFADALAKAGGGDFHFSPPQDFV